MSSTSATLNVGLALEFRSNDLGRGDADLGVAPGGDTTEVSHGTESSSKSEN